LAAAALTFVFLLPQVHAHITAELTGPRRAILAGLLALFAWFMTFGLFGTCLLMKRGYNAATRYLADASYWVYLVHLPFVGLAQIAVARLATATPAKFLLAALITISLSLMTYHSFVRYTWVGEFLNGYRRKRKSGRRDDVSERKPDADLTVIFIRPVAVPRREAA